MSKVFLLWLLCASFSGVAHSIPLDEQLLSTPERSNSIQGIATSLNEDSGKLDLAVNQGYSAVEAPPPEANSPATESSKAQTPAKDGKAAPFKIPDHPPGNDTWYLPPKGFEATKPGTILKYRRVPRGISLDNKNAIKIKASYQIQYRTESSMGDPVATIVTVLVPFEAKPNNLWMYHWFADSSYQECIPSITMQPGTRADNSFTQKQNGIIITALAQGWYVAVADDGGPTGIFANGLRQGKGTLDALRAIKQSNQITGINPDPIITLFGYSGGSITGTWATELQPTYAPDVKIAGAALGGLLPNTTYLFVEQALSTNRSSYGPPVMIGQSKDFKNYTDWIQDNLKPDVAHIYRAAYSQCYDSNWDLFTGRTTGSYFKGGDASLLSEIPKSIMGSVGTAGQTGTPTVPWYVFETIGDDASPVEMADALVAKHCKNGANIQYERNEHWVTHSQEMIEGLPGAMRWSMDRHEGKPIVPGCRTSAVSPETTLARKQGIMITGLIINALAPLGVSLGPNDWTDWLMMWPVRYLSPPS